ncbi:TRAP transporter small permease [Microbaculum marinum]|uniref:TRAP transporter small permease protein n=1 Tax=Microbaculum marinum TaxID=1764581 RepID=A0AAW9RHY6_9HYPH
MSDGWGRQLDLQSDALPRGWSSLDRGLLKTTRIVLFVVGSLFTLMISLEVVSRYAFGFSTFFVSAAARFLLLWFFMLGAGLALRVGAHVGFELLLRALGPRRRRILQTVINVLALVFFAEMVWGGVLALGPAAMQMDSALNVSLVWAFLAVPVGFVLLIYHVVVLMVTGLQPTGAEEHPI